MCVRKYIHIYIYRERMREKSSLLLDVDVLVT